MTCTIRPWLLDDAAALAAILNNKTIQNNLRDGIPFPYTEQDARDYLLSTLQSDPNSTFAFAITVDGAVAGSIGLFRQENIHCRTAELGYYVAEPLWGQGVGSAAVTQACRYVFATTDILRIFAEPFAYNLASCRLLEKAGFQLEGVLRQNAVQHGQVLDMKLYSLLKEDGTA